jgi:hypothetical protein
MTRHRQHPIQPDTTYSGIGELTYSPSGTHFVPSLLTPLVRSYPGPYGSMIDTVHKGPWKWDDCQHDQVMFDCSYYDPADSLHSPKTNILYTESGLLSNAWEQDVSRLLKPYMQAKQRRGIPFLQDILARSSLLPRGIELDRDPFDTGVNIWFLVRDLIDLKHLLPQILQIVRHAGALKRRYKGRSIADIKAIPNAYLLDKFGIDPTLDDIEQFVKLIAKWREMYDHLDSLMQVMHVVKSPAIDFLQDRSYDFQESFTVPPMFGKGTDQLYCQVQHNVTQLEWHGTAKYKFSAPDAKGWLARLKQFMDAFGVLDVGSAVWDLIPFSFLVDWFVGVGPWLHKNRIQLFPASILLQDYCESISYVDRMSITMDWLQPIDWPHSLSREGRHLEVARAIHRIYLRRRGQPRNLRLSRPKISKSFISLTKCAIGGSLAAQRLIR